MLWNDVFILILFYVFYSIASLIVGVSSNGRTTDSDSVYCGSNPYTPAIFCKMIV